MAETGKMKTYSDAIEALLSKSVMLSPELLEQVESFIKENAGLGYTSKVEFIQDAVRLRLISPTEKRTATNNKPGTQRLKDLVTRAKHTERKQ